MKVKKLLSVSTIGLTIAFCGSIGVFATNNALNTEKKEMIQAVIKSYYSGANPINNLDLNKNTKVKDIFNSNSEYYKKIAEKLNSYGEGAILNDMVKNGASVSEVLNSSLIYASLNQDNFIKYKNMTIDLANQLIDIDKTEDQGARAIKEKKASEMINSSYGNVKFGKNASGHTTVSIEKNKQIILQIDAVNAEKLVDIISSFNSYDEFKDFLVELGIKVQ